VVDSLLALSTATWYNLGLAVVVVSAAIMAVIAYRAWAEAHEDLDPVSSQDLLASFDQARAAGELDDEEYDRVRKRIQDAGAGDAGGRTE
jgi:hypothetical protein